MQKLLVKNRRATFDYEVLERFTAGIVLFGHEVKSLKSGGGHFTGSYITEKRGELYLEHFHIPLYKKATLEGYEPERSRKLLLRKVEILKIASALHTDGVTIVPLECGIENGKIKIYFALARGKKKYDKRESIKKKETARQVQRALKY
jgi:SsrA-binding protein